MIPSSKKPASSGPTGISGPSGSVPAATRVAPSSVASQTVTIKPSQPQPQLQPQSAAPQLSSDPQRKILPKNFLNCPKDDLIVLITRMLASLVRINDAMAMDVSPNHLTRFHSRTPPSISIKSYLARLAKYSSLENAILLASVYYIDLLSATYRTFSLNSLTIHRFLLTSTTVGAKGLCDSFCTNAHYAKVGGVSVGELNVLEMEFLTRVNWRIVPTNRDHHRGCENSASHPRSTVRLRDQEQDEMPCEEGVEEQSGNSNKRGLSEGKVPKRRRRHTDETDFRSNSFDCGTLGVYYRRIIMLVGRDSIGEDDNCIYELEDGEEDEEDEDYDFGEV